ETTLVPFSLGNLLLRNDPTSNLELQPQDSIYIFNKWFFWDKPYFTVSGEVRTSGRFELAENYKVKDAILTAGDLTKDAFLKKGEIIRVNKKKEYQTLYFDVTKAMSGDPAENLPIRDEDQIIIHSLYEEQWKESVTVAGEVKSPGDYLLTDRMQVSDLIFKAGGQTRDTLLDQTELYRTDWKTKEVTLKKINLDKAMAGDPAENLELQDLDRLIVHSIWEKVYKKSVTIEGDVLKPGTYPLADNMKVRDLIFAAGNVLESASLGDAEISSQVIGRNNQAGIVHQKINLGKAMAGDPAHNINLKSYDRLFIQRIPDWRPEKFVTMMGEIKFPGRYMISKG
ncbi:MAG: SLBB domain-containing protein, partial [Thermodesulfobacteriota bacterium]